jgi:hypothetical protein
MEATVPSLDNQDTENRSTRWLGIVQTAMVQVMVLLALSVAVVYYLDWSSDKAWEEFLAASKSEGLVLKSQLQSVMPLHVGSGKAPCAKKG